MKYEIETGLAPLLTLRLTDGEIVFATEMSAAWLSSNFEVKTGARGALVGRVTGDAVTATTYTCTAGMGTLTFSVGLPGVVFEYALKPTTSMIVQRGGFIVGENSARIGGAQTKRLEGSLYGLEGFSVHKFSGPGSIFLFAIGGVVERKLEAREELWVEPGNLLMLEATVGLEIAPVRNAWNLAGGANERMHHALLKGPGVVWLQHGSRQLLRALLQR